MSKFIAMHTLEKAIDLLKICLYAAEWIAALTGFLCWHKVKNSYWRWFPVYLLFIAVAETFNHLYGETYQWFPRFFFPFVLLPLEYLFFGWLFFRQETTSKKHWLFLFCLLIYIASFVAEQFLFSGKHFWFHSLSYSVGNILLLVIIIRYLSLFLHSDRVLTYKTNRMFIVCTGLIIFYFGTFPFFGLANTLWHNYPNLAMWYLAIMFVLNSMMYLLFSISFIWGRTK